ncbi:DUF6392 family protein [Pseudomonas gingeri]|uniref:DUF6392 family protein n=1 Tax=Pseudomonas gingeri TaxID=117681 RepID=UPI00159FBE2E|nr:DUF6392 family protein [Pseudomonas gingeri]NWA04951.1 hypothetical protein [Pseudomonas gingeri]NWA17748.1 hypothetical protein [Pseudomonas gingeri]NWA59190.1 hypothetical protein [Pseudomonas gingeri]NWA99386.1 hypothetical protein [Pseudomonas gingeri]NWB04608.1 hypothetical protein [Pseudomonas gingeri]
MDAATINRWTESLGCTYEELVAGGVISSSQPLTQLFKGDDELIQNPTSGISLWFWSETRRLEKIIITLIQTVDGQTIYTAGLPSPFSPKMNKASVHALFGEPMQSKGAAKIPGSGGQISGGWDAYRLQECIHPNARVGFSYTADLRVKTLAFALIDRGHD